MSDSNERLLACLIYVTSFFTTIIGPLLIWLIKKDDSPFIDFHGKQYLNFLISYSIYGIVSAILMLILIGFLLAAIVGILFFIFTIVGAIRAYEGAYYRIPLTIQFFR